MGEKWIPGVSADRRRNDRRNRPDMRDENHMIPAPGHRGHIAQWVDSAALKALQQVVTLVLLPAAVWGVNVVVDRLGKIDDRLARGETTAATVEIRIQAVERVNDAQQGALSSLDARLRAVESDVRAATAHSANPAHSPARKL